MNDPINLLNDLVHSVSFFFFSCYPNFEFTFWGTIMEIRTSGSFIGNLSRLRPSGVYFIVVILSKLFCSIHRILIVGDNTDRQAGRQADTQTYHCFCVDFRGNRT